MCQIISGLIGYCRRFVKRYGDIATPLTKLLQKSASRWSEDATKAFEQLNQVMVSVSVLALPHFSLPFIIETGIGGSFNSKFSSYSLFQSRVGSAIAG